MAGIRRVSIPSEEATESSGLTMGTKSRPYLVPAVLRPTGTIRATAALIFAIIPAAAQSLNVEGFACMYETSPGSGTIGVIERGQCVPAFRSVIAGPHMEPIVRLSPGPSAEASEIVSCPKDFTPVIYRGNAACAREIVEPVR